MHVVAAPVHCSAWICVVEGAEQVRWLMQCEDVTGSERLSRQHDDVLGLHV